MRESLEQSSGLSASWSTGRTRYRTSFPLEEVRLQLDDGREVSVIVKSLGREGLDERRDGPSQSFSTIPCAKSWSTRWSWQVESSVPALLRVDRGGRGRPLSPVSREGRRGRALADRRARGLGEGGRWAAHLHAELKPAASPHLIRYSADFLRSWIDRAVDLRGAPSSCGSPRATTLSSSVLRRYRLCSCTASSTRRRSGRAGAPHLSRRLGDGGNRPGRSRPRGARVSRGDEEAARLARAYHDVLPGTFEPADLDYARLHLAVQWLGWSRDWTPPQEHATDWLGEAASAADRVGL